MLQKQKRFKEDRPWELVKLPRRSSDLQRLWKWSYSSLVSLRSQEAPANSGYRRNTEKIMLRYIHIYDMLRKTKRTRAGWRGPVTMSWWWDMLGKWWERGVCSQSYFCPLLCTQEGLCDSCISP